MDAERIKRRNDFAVDWSKSGRTSTTIKFDVPELDERMKDVLRLKQELVLAIEDLREATREMLGVEITAE